TVAADCTVTIEGNLAVAGQFLQGEIKPDPSDPRFVSLVATQWATGTLTGEMQLDALFSGVNAGQLAVGIADQQEPPVPIKGRVIEPSDVLLYSFVVMNASSSPITNIQLYTS